MRKNYDAWAVGAAMVLLSVLGVIMASAAEDTMFYVTGLAFALFGVLFIFGLISRNVGRK